MPSSPSLQTTGGSSEAMSAQAQRRERKRKHDREAQRVSRERTKARVKELEELVKTLQAANECPERISDLLPQISGAREENTKLRERMRKAADILAMDAPSDSHEHEQQNHDHSLQLSLYNSMPTPENYDLDFSTPAMQTSEDITIFETPRPSSMHDTHFPDATTELHSLDYPVGNFKLPGSLHDVPSVTTNADFELTKCVGSRGSTESDPVSTIASTILKDPSLEGRFWLLAGTILNYILNMAEHIVTPRALEDDIVIRSCVEGWDVVSQMYWLDAGWRWLRQLDEYVNPHVLCSISLGFGYVFIFEVFLACLTISGTWALNAGK
jgi:hypothetical protein